MQKDILVFLSDQHAAFCTGFAGDAIVRTPNLNRIAKKSIVFDSAYTSCPLCIPARMSLLTGRFPSELGIFENEGSIPSELMTFLHALGANGYETVLCGRMHFEGFDQRHGFTKRIAGDITHLYTGDKKGFHKNGAYSPSLTEAGCLRIIGGGNSPVLEYDRYVIHTALQYLNEYHKKPQCIVIGTFAPHFPYIAPEQLYEYYLPRVSLPKSINKNAYNYFCSLYSTRVSDTSEETVRQARAAYYGMVEFMDNNIGIVYDAWNKYLSQNRRSGLFVYLSDHGDQVGERGFYGKKTFFDSSVHIPLLFTTNENKSEKHITHPVSIMDIGATLCDYAGTKTQPGQQGKSLLPYWENKTGAHTYRIIISEAIEKKPQTKQPVPGRMAFDGRWKYITYFNYENEDLLFDMHTDPNELQNIAHLFPDEVKHLRAYIYRNWHPRKVIRSYCERAAHIQLLNKWQEQTNFRLEYEKLFEHNNRWKIPKNVLTLPDHYYTSTAPLSAEFQMRINNMLQG